MDAGRGILHETSGRILPVHMERGVVVNMGVVTGGKEIAFEWERTIGQIMVAIMNLLEWIFRDLVVVEEGEEDISGIRWRGRKGLTTTCRKPERERKMQTRLW